MDFSLSKEQKDIVKAAKEFARKEFGEVAQEFDRNESFDINLWKKACDLGFVGVFIEEKYEGAGYGFFEHCLITEEFWAADPGIGQAILSCTFGAEILLLFGSEEQKRDPAPTGFRPGHFGYSHNRTGCRVGCHRGLHHSR